MKRFNRDLRPDPTGELCLVSDYTYIYNRLRDMVDLADQGKLSQEEINEARRLIEESDREHYQQK